MGNDHLEYEKLIKPVEDRMICSIWRITHDPDDADDALQEALFKIWKRLNRIKRHPNPHALILRICINSAYDVLRVRAKQRRHAELNTIQSNVPDPTPTSEENITNQENRTEIFEAIEKLSQNQAETVLMRIIQGLPFRDIAQALGCREATARKHFARAREKLVKLLAHLAPYSKEEIV